MLSARWIIVAVEGRFAGREFTIPAGGFSLGREEDNDLILEDDNISRHHAVFAMVQGRVVLQDLKSRNGTYVNNRRVRRVELQEGDRIALGSHLFEVKNAAILDEKTEAIPDFEGELETEHEEATPVLAEIEDERTILKPSVSKHANSKHAKRTRPDAYGPAERGPGLHGAVVGVDQDEKTNILPSRESKSSRVQLTSGTVHGGMSEGEVDEFRDTVGGEEEPLVAAEGDDRNGCWDEPASEAPFAEQDRVAPLPPPRAPAAKKNRRLPLIIGLALLVVGSVLVVGLQSQFGETNSRTSQKTQTTPRPQWLSSEIEAPVRCRIPSLSQAEKAMSHQERVDAANEHFDQGEIFLGSEKLREACDEFEYALALNPDCKVCLIRLGKTKAEIKRKLEKYKGDAIRSYRAMEYDKAKRYWELALELESDPEGRRIMIEGIRNAKNQKQSYR